MEEEFVSLWRRFRYHQSAAASLVVGQSGGGRCRIDIESGRFAATAFRTHFAYTFAQQK
jgi:hypothetical protein